MSQKKKLSRKERRLQQVERERRMRALRIWIPVTVIVLAFVGLVAYRIFQPDVAGAQFIESPAGGQHEADPQFPAGGLPPMGGPHAPAWQNCGIYLEPINPAHAIHSMEHGAIWVTYDPQLPQEQISRLEDAVRGESYLLLSPYPQQDSPIVLTAWDVQLQLDSAADDRLGEFIDRYKGSRGPESGASCSGGVGQPLS